jgi:excisionase family DNA binding protein
LRLSELRDNTYPSGGREGQSTGGGAPHLYSTRDLAQLFNRSDRTIRNWVRSGLLKPIRVGRSVFFNVAEVARLMEIPASPNRYESDV